MDFADPLMEIFERNRRSHPKTILGGDGTRFKIEFVHLGKSLMCGYTETLLAVRFDRYYLSSLDLGLL